MDWKAFLKKHFMTPVGAKLPSIITRYAPCGDGSRIISLRWQEHISYGAGSPPDVRIVSCGDQDMAEAFAEFLGECPMRLANALEDLDFCQKQLARFKGETWRGEAVAYEDDGERGGIWLVGADILNFPRSEWCRHFSYWFPSWEALAAAHALSPCGVGVAEGQPYVRLKPYPKPRLGGLQ